MGELPASEIEALARIMDELDYYQLMNVPRGASVPEVKRAFYASSRNFHPDANRNLPADLREVVGQISKRVTEAYAVLRDPRRRQAYDRMLDESSGKRMQLAEAEAGARRQAQENEGRTPQGRNYYNLARAAIEREDWGGAARNLQTALTFEPDNDTFKECLKQAKEKWR